MIKDVGIDWNRAGKIGNTFSRLDSGAVECIVLEYYLYKGK